MTSAPYDNAPPAPPAPTGPRARRRVPLVAAVAAVAVALLVGATAGAGAVTVRQIFGEQWEHACVPEEYPAVSPAGGGRCFADLAVLPQGWQCDTEMFIDDPGFFPATDPSGTRSCFSPTEPLPDGWRWDVRRG